MKKFVQKAVAVAGLAIAFPSAMTATDYFVSVAGAGEKDGTSWENAAAGPDVLKAAFISGLTSGDRILMSGGTYTMPSATLTFPAGVTLQGGFPVTLTGTETDIDYMWGETAETILDCVKTLERSTPVLKVQGGTNISGEDAKKGVLNRFVGFTLANAKIRQTSGYGAPAIYLRNAGVEMAFVKVLDNEITGTTNGGVTEVINGYFRAHDCVWSGNSCYSVAPAVRFANTGIANACVGVVERCEFSGNSVSLAVNNYGGALAMSDNGGTLYMVNCTVTGTEVVKGGAMARIGGNCTFVSINNTWFDCTCSGVYAGNKEVGTHLNGVILSMGDRATTKIANTIAVNKSDFAAEWKASHPTADVKKYTTVYIQQNAGSTSTYIPYGYNVFGSVCDEASTTDIAATNDVDADNLTGRVFGSETPDFAAHGGNGTKVAAPVTAYKMTPLADITALKELWALPEEINLELDQRGLYRGATTYAGAYDPGATTGVDMPLSPDMPEGFSITPAGNGHYTVSGATGSAVVYTVMGRQVLEQFVDGAADIDLSGLAKGVYVVCINGKAAKVSR